MKNRNIIYSLSVEDIQTVAFQELGRYLLPDEIGKIEEVLAEKINWHEAISSSIDEINISTIFFRFLLDFEYYPEACDITEVDISNKAGA